MTRIQVGKKTKELLANPDFSEWDDEELIRGQRKNRRGVFNGALPKVIPLALLQELHKRNASHAIHRLEQLLLPAIEYLGDVIEGRVEPDPDRIRVCETLLNRVLGKTQERVVVTSGSENKYQQAGVKKAVVLRDLSEPEERPGVIDVEVVDDDENPFE